MNSMKIHLNKTPFVSLDLFMAPDICSLPSGRIHLVVYRDRDGIAASAMGQKERLMERCRADSVCS